MPRNKSTQLCAVRLKQLSEYPADLQFIRCPSLYRWTNFVPIFMNCARAVFKGSASVSAVLVEGGLRKDFERVTLQQWGFFCLQPTE